MTSDASSPPPQPPRVVPPPIVSVILPVHNAELTVAETIRSILNQTFFDFEFLILDDGSTDGSSAIIDEAARHDERIRVWHQENAGFAVSLNRLISHARGRYLARIDADDVALPQRLEQQVEYFNAHDEVVVVGSQVISMDADGDDYGLYEVPLAHEQIESQILNGRGGIIHPSVMMRRDVVDSVGGYSLDFPVCEDQDLWLRLALHGRLVNLPTPLTKYRVHAGNMSFVEMTHTTARLRQVIQRANAERGLPVATSDDSPLPESIMVDEWDRRRTWAWTAVAHAHWGTARKHARRLVCERPWRINGWKLLVASYLGGS